MEYLITDTRVGVAKQNFVVGQEHLPKEFPCTFDLQHKVLQGGKQAGTELITLKVGDLVLRVSPTRGMGIIDAQYKDVRLGWDSPVKEIVNPAFIELTKQGGLGWLEGFNELVVRCGYQWAGHPGEDGGEMLSLHGQIQNIPASVVRLNVDTSPPYRVRLSGRVDERCFKRAEFEVWMHLDILPGESAFTLTDELINRGAYAREFQVIYHNNFGSPLLEAGAQVEIPVAQISAFNKRAVEGLASWNLMPAPTLGFDEEVFNIRPLGDSQGDTLVMLKNASSQRAIALRFKLDQLPVFTLWKNTDTPEQGYVVGLEPGTSFAYNRRYQRDLGLVPQIGAGESRLFQQQFEILTNADAVQRVSTEIAQLQSQASPEVLSTPLVDLNS